jgi:hypothetical protein
MRWSLLTALQDFGRAERTRFAHGGMVKKNEHSSSGDARNSAVERLNDHHGQPATLLARLQIANCFFSGLDRGRFFLPLPWPRLPAFFIMLPGRRFTERMISLPDAAKALNLWFIMRSYARSDHQHAHFCHPSVPVRSISQSSNDANANASPDDFSSNYQSVDGIIEGLRQARLPYSALQNIWRFGYAPLFARLHSIEREANNVNLALRLDVLAVLAVFAFVGAILLGVF